MINQFKKKKFDALNILYSPKLTIKWTWYFRYPLSPRINQTDCTTYHGPPARDIHQAVKGFCLTRQLPRVVKFVLLWYKERLMTYNIKQKQKYGGMFETQKSEDKTSSGEIGLNIRKLASPKVGQDQVSGGVSVLCWHAAPKLSVLFRI